MPPESFDARMGAILRYLHERFGDGGKTSAQIAADLGLEPRECAAKLRSLAEGRVIQTSAQWEAPARYWIEWNVSRALLYVDALAHDEALRFVAGSTGGAS